MSNYYYLIYIIYDILKIIKYLKNIYYFNLKQNKNINSNILNKNYYIYFPKINS